MLKAVEKYPEAKSFIIATENGMLHQLRQRFPHQEFVAADGCIGCRLHCPYMKVTDLQDVYFSLLYERYEIKLDDEVIVGARRAFGADDGRATGQLNCGGLQLALVLTSRFFEEHLLDRLGVLRSSRPAF